jgi:hypothetical protein
MTKVKVMNIPLFFVLVLGGCNSIAQKPHSEVVPVIDRGSDLNNRFEELHVSRAMTPGQLEPYLASRELNFLDNPNFDNRMTLVLLLAAGDKAIRDQVRALELLEGIGSVPIDTADQELVLILKQFLETQLATSRRYDLLSKQLSEQDKQIEELKQQLRELTTIEQNIQQRDKALEDRNGE